METTPVFYDYRSLNEIISHEKAAGKIIVCTIGSWDLLHAGHIEYLKDAKAHGDILVVGIDSNTAFEKYKKRPPTYPLEDRVTILSSIKFIDYIAIIDDVDLEGNWEYHLAKVLSPNIFVYNNKSYSKEQIETLADITENIVSLPYEDKSDSVKISDRLKQIRISEMLGNLRMKENAFRISMIILIFFALSAITIIILTGFGITNYSDAVLKLIISAIIAEIIGMIAFIIKYLFSKS